MKSSIKKLSDTSVELTVTAESTDFAKTVDSVYNDLAKEIKADGFRKGKVPRQILKQKAGIGYISGEVTSQVVSDTYQKAAIEHDLKVMAQPEIKVSAAFDANDETKPVEFVATVDVRPEIAVPKVEGRKITVEVTDPTKEQIKDRIDTFRKNSAVKDADGNEELPDDEELFGMLDVQDMKELEAKVKEDLQMTSLSNVVAKAGDEILEVLLKEVKFDLPQKVVEETVDSFIRSNYQGEREPTAEEVKETTKRAEHDIRSQVLLDTYADTNDIKVSQNEIINYVGNMANQYGIDPNQFIQMILQQGQLPMISAEVSRSKTLAHMLRRVDVVDQKGKTLDLSKFIGTLDDENAGDTPKKKSTAKAKSTADAKKSTGKATTKSTATKSTATKTTATKSTKSNAAKTTKKKETK